MDGPVTDLLLAVPVVAATVLMFVLLQLKPFQGLMILLLAVSVLLGYLLVPGNYFLFTLVFGALGQLVHFVLVGLWGSTKPYSWYKTPLVLGLFPWALSPVASTAFAVALLVFWGLLAVTMRRKGGKVAPSAIILGALVASLLAVAIVPAL